MSSAIGLIAGLHNVIGGLARQPHWFLNEADAKRYGEAVARAARHFPVHVAQKTIDVMTLVCTAASIELPRIGISIQLAQMKHAPQAQQRGPAQVFQFVSPHAAPPVAPGAVKAEGASAATVPPAADAPHDASSDIDAIGGEPAA